MSKAEEIIAKFPEGSSWLARELGTEPSTVNSWKRRGSIPRWRHDAILRVAKKHKISLSSTDFSL